MYPSDKAHRELVGRFVLGVALLVLALLMGWPQPPVRAGGQKSPARALPADLQVVPSDAIVFATLDLAALQKTDLVKPLEKELGPDGETGREFRVLFGIFAEQLSPRYQVLAGLLGTLSGIERLTAYVVIDARAEFPYADVAILRTRHSLSHAKVLGPLGRTSEKTVDGNTYHVATTRPLKGTAVAFIGNQIAVLGPEPQVRTLLGKKPAPRSPTLEEALNLAAKSQFHAWLNLDDPVMVQSKKAIFADKTIPARAKVLEKTKHVGLTFSLDRTSVLTMNLAMSDKESAANNAKFLRSTLSSARESLATVFSAKRKDETPLLRTGKHLAGQLKNTRIVAKDNRVEVDLRLLLTIQEANWRDEFASAMLETAKLVRLAAQRTMSQNNLKQLCLALWSYHDAMKGFPAPAITSQQGKPLLSWRVAILPYLSEGALYNEFKLDEPWDSKHNLKLLTRMPRMFAAPEVLKGDAASLSAKGMTFYQGVVGKGAAFEPGRRLRFPDFADGTSQIIMLVEAATPVPWTKPEDVAYAAKGPAPKLGGLFEAVVHVALADGGVRAIRREKLPGILKEYLQRDSGKPRSILLDD
jgi:hypothetical protein